MLLPFMSCYLKGEWVRVHAGTHYGERIVITRFMVNDHWAYKRLITFDSIGQRGRKVRDGN